VRVAGVEGGRGGEALVEAQGVGGGEAKPGADNRPVPAREHAAACAGGQESAEIVGEESAEIEKMMRLLLGADCAGDEVAWAAADVARREPGASRAGAGGHAYIDAAAEPPVPGCGCAQGAGGGQVLVGREESEESAEGEGSCERLAAWAAGALAEITGTTVDEGIIMVAVGLAVGAEEELDAIGEVDAFLSAWTDSLYPVRMHVCCMLPPAALPSQIPLWSMGEFAVCLRLLLASERVQALVG